MRRVTETLSSLSLRAKTYVSYSTFIWKQSKELPFNCIHLKSQGRHKVCFLCFLDESSFSIYFYMAVLQRKFDNPYEKRLNSSLQTLC